MTSWWYFNQTVSGTRRSPFASGSRFNIFTAQSRSRWYAVARSHPSCSATYRQSTSRTFGRSGSGFARARRRRGARTGGAGATASGPAPSGGGFEAGSLTHGPPSTARRARAGATACPPPR